MAKETMIYYRFGWVYTVYVYRVRHRFSTDHLVRVTEVDPHTRRNLQSWETQYKHTANAIDYADRFADMTEPTTAPAGAKECA